MAAALQKAWKHMKTPALKNHPHAVRIDGFLAHCWGWKVGPILVHRLLMHPGRLYQLTHVPTGLRVGKVAFRSVVSAVKAARTINRSLDGLGAVRFDDFNRLSPSALRLLKTHRKRWPGIEKKLRNANRIDVGGEIVPLSARTRAGAAAE
jgi:hypothetical protein